MTWHAQDGQLVLREREAEVFRDAILYMCDMIASETDDEESTFGGAAVFDQMTRSQQFASLEKVSRYLFHTTEECLELTAWSEATLASILHEIRTFVHLEVDEQQNDKLRKFIHDTLGKEWEFEDWNSIREWDAVMDAYESRFLWDSDYDNDSIADLPPKHAERLRGMMRIPDDYYTAIPPDFELDRDTRHGTKRVWMAIDGKKMLKMTATLMIEVPASLEIKQDEDGCQTAHGCFPYISIMRDLGNGDATEADDSIYDFFVDGSETDHSFEELPYRNIDEEGSMI